MNAERAPMVYLRFVGSRPPTEPKWLWFKQFGLLLRPVKPQCSRCCFSLYQTVLLGFFRHFWSHRPSPRRFGHGRTPGGERCRGEWQRVGTSSNPKLPAASWVCFKVFCFLDGFLKAFVKVLCYFHVFEGVLLFFGHSRMLFSLGFWKAKKENLGTTRTPKAIGFTSWSWWLLIWGFSRPKWRTSCWCRWTHRRGSWKLKNFKKTSRVT